ncbi:hypothetical protein [Plantactinospora sp. GCM10030261]|uniref:hypothetical protein n=1 Tax=Plantactinospora sp. GCM10030261 TaxID=3273420 RepID=UPI0036228C46
MATESAQWQELSSRVEALALKLRLHLAQASDDDAARAAVGRLRATIDDAFEAAGNAMSDNAVRQDIREVGRLLVDALDTTFARVGTDIRGALRQR